LWARCTGCTGTERLIKQPLSTPFFKLWLKWSKIRYFTALSCYKFKFPHSLQNIHRTDRKFLSCLPPSSWQNDTYKTWIINKTICSLYCKLSSFLFPYDKQNGTSEPMET
jgi:hypothetical protein